MIPDDYEPLRCEDIEKGEQAATLLTIVNVMSSRDNPEPPNKNVMILARCVGTGKPYGVLFRRRADLNRLIDALRSARDDVFVAEQN
jgi:hypothetical protein